MISDKFASYCPIGVSGDCTSIYGFSVKKCDSTYKDIAGGNIEYSCTVAGVNFISITNYVYRPVNDNPIFKTGIGTFIICITMKQVYMGVGAIINQLIQFCETFWRFDF